MELNFLNEKLNVDVNKHHIVNEQMFWHYYCQMLNIRNQTLTEKECVLLSHLLSFPVGSNIGEMIIMKQVASITNIVLPNLYAKYKQLVEKGFMTKTEDGFFLNSALISFQSYIQHMVKTKGEHDIKFSIPFTIRQY